MSPLLKQFLSFSSYLFAFGMTMILFLQVIFAFMNGNEIRVTINDFGEAYLDLAIVIIASPVLFYGLIIRVKEYKIRTKDDNATI